MNTGSSLGHFYKQMIGYTSHFENTILQCRRNMSFSVNKCYYCISRVVVNTRTPSSTTAINTMIVNQLRIVCNQVKQKEKNDMLTSRFECKFGFSETKIVLEKHSPSESFLNEKSLGSRIHEAQGCN